jgi:hypothetical protein
MPKGVYPHIISNFKGKKHSIESKKKLSLSYQGKKYSKETKQKMSESQKRIGNKPPSSKGNKYRLGHKHSVKTREKMSIAHKGYKAYGWKGGITPINAIFRSSLKYRLWREAVFKRDKFTCRLCMKVGGKLNADHIKPFAHFPELRLSIENGRTLCLDCHKKTDTYLNKSRWLKIDVEKELNAPKSLSGSEVTVTLNGVSYKAVIQ